MTGCSEDPAEQLIPVLIPSDQTVPGKALTFATSCRECTGGCGLHVRTREGRAVKIEGNPDHPLNRGKLCAIGQAALQGLYNPARLKRPFKKEDGVESKISWKEATDRLLDYLGNRQQASNKRILFIGRPENGTLRSLIENSLQSWGGGDYLAIDLSPVHSARTANDIVFGENTLPAYDFSHVDTLVNFGADFLETWLNPIQLTRQYSDFHVFKNGKKGRFIQISPYLSLTGTNADRWFPCASGTESTLALLLTERLLEGSPHLSKGEKAYLRRWLEPQLNHPSAQALRHATDYLDTLVDLFKTSKCLVLAGGNCTAGNNATQLQVAVNLLNTVCGALHRSIRFGPDFAYGGDSLARIKQAIKQLDAGGYDLVFVHNVNPVHSLAHLPELAGALKRAAALVSFSTERDETTELASLALPTHHPLESWGDIRVANGIHNLQQPVMRPPPGFDTRSLGDLLLEINLLNNPSGQHFKSFDSLLAQRWQKIHQATQPDIPFSRFWQECLMTGGNFSSPSFRTVALRKELPVKPEPGALKQAEGLSLLCVNSNLQQANGDTGNRYWLLETPHPVSQSAWDIWVDIHPDTAKRYGIRDNDTVRVSTPYGQITASARLFYGIAPNTLAVPTGYGRMVGLPSYPSKRESFPFLPRFNVKTAGELSWQTIGENSLKLLSPDSEPVSGDFQFTATGVRVERLDQASRGVFVDGQYRRDISDRGLDIVPRSQKGRGLIQTLSLDQKGSLSAPHLSASSQAETGIRGLQSGFYGDTAESAGGDIVSTDDPVQSEVENNKWEMVIDLDRCTGCSACVVACYAENNIAIVGKERMREGREMSWIRIERYFEINPQTGKTESYFSPQMCAQCDNAGCEPVCPVSATYKTADGLNAMIYSRCIGSRYCANNCIFDQRRFNWRSYHFPSPLHYQLNPDVSVREKGIMEKCTFCQHRIREKILAAKAEGRALAENEVQTACQQTCPADAITFGNIRHPESRISRLKSDKTRAYTQFPSLNFQPSVTYLKKVLHNQQKA